MTRTRTFRRSGLTAAVVVGALAALTISAPAIAAPQAALTIVSTGTAPFDATAGPGNDSSATDGIVRTNDSVVVQGQALIDTTVTGARLLFTLGSADATWEAVPPQCDAATSSIAGPVLTCGLGNRSQETLSISPSYLVGPNAQNGEQISVTSTFASDQTAPVSSAPQAVTVSAQPRWDLRKDLGARTVGTVLNGVNGFLISWPVMLDGPSSHKGAEAVAGNTLTFTDDLSHLYPGLPVGSGSPQLVAYGPNGTSVSLDTIPNGSTSSGAANAVTNSGTWTCTQTGTSIGCTITGADLSMQHVPTQTAAGAALPAGVAPVVSGVIQIFVPKADLDAYAPDANAQLVNHLVDFSPTSVSGQQNYGGTQEPGFDGSGNNQGETTIANFNSGTAFKTYGNDLNNPAVNRQIAPGASGLKTGDGVVTPGQPFSGLIAFANRSAGGLTDLTICDAVDNTVNIVSGTNSVEVDTGSIGAVTYEYAGGPAWASPAAQAAADCSDGAGPWFSSPAQVPGGAAAVTRVRAVISSISIGGYVIVYFGLTASPTLANGTFMRNFGVVSSPDLPGELRSGDPTGAADSMADHILGATAIARVAKSTMAPGDDPNSPSDSINTVVAGGTVTFDLRPTFTSANAAGQAYPYTVTDTLPAGLSYVAGSASLAPTSTTQNPDGTTTLVWDLGDLTPNEPITPITYQAAVSVAAANGTQLENTVVVSSPADASPAVKRTADRGIQASNAAGFAVLKSTSTPVIYPGQNQVYALSVGNASANALTGLDVIDVLPFSGDGRTPATAYTGSQGVSTVTSTVTTLQYRYTDAAPATISPDPRNASNQTGGSTTWCLVSQFGTPGCPSGLAQATAFRATDTAPFPAGTTTVIDVTLATSGNASGDTYANQFSAVADGLTFTLPSNTVSVSVVAGAIGITKQVCVQADPAACDAADDADWTNDQLIPDGATATWRIEVTNTGTLPLHDVSVTDELSESMTGPAASCVQTFTGTLAPGDSEPAYTCTTTNVHGAVTNTAIAHGTPNDPTAGDGPPIDSPPASARVHIPAPTTPPTPPPTTPPGSTPPGEPPLAVTGGGFPTVAAVIGVVALVLGLVALARRRRSTH